MTEKREAPTKAEIALLEPFVGMSLEQIVVPSTADEFARAETDLMACRFIGFDSESKPCFKPGQVSDGPHVIQLTTLNTAYIFQLHHQTCHQLLTRILQSPTVVKVGFGLKSDRAHLLRKLGVRLTAVLDMNQMFREEGYRKEMGLKAAVAVTFNQRLQKSKSVSTSNWALPVLKNNQLLYAANDAYVALKVLVSMYITDREEKIGRDLPIQYAYADSETSSC